MEIAFFSQDHSLDIASGLRIHALQNYHRLYKTSRERKFNYFAPYIAAKYSLETSSKVSRLMGQERL